MPPAVDLIITDEIRDVVAAQQVSRQYRNAYPVSVMSVGTEEGAPIPVADERGRVSFLKDRQGNLVIPKVNSRSLRDFADLSAGRFSPMSLTDEDLEFLLAEQPLAPEDQFREIERDFDVWFEEGPWLLLLLLPLASLAFRRGWLWVLALLVILPGEQAQAFGWDDLWQTRDQQAKQALDAGDPARAAELFENPAWRATASYRSENFEAAANQFGEIKSSDGYYNLGNALARQGLLDEAIEAYDEALSLNPGDEDAAFNKKLIEDLLQQQQEQQQQQQDNEQDQENQEQQDSEQDQEQQQRQEQEQESSSDEEDQEQQEESQQEQQSDEQQNQEAQAQKAAEEGG